MDGQAPVEAGGPREIVGALRTGVRGLDFTRHRVRAFYDDWLAERRLPDGPANFLHGIVAAAESILPDALDPADDADALALALGALGDPKHVVEFAAAATAAGVIAARPAGAGDAAAPRDPVTLIRGLVGAPETRATLHNGTLHKLTSPAAFWTNPGHLAAPLLLAGRRLCRILVRNPVSEEIETGSGFLIGPSMVLTNEHVIASIKTRKDATDWVAAQFDFSSTTGLMDAPESTIPAHGQDWLVDSSDHGDSGPDAAYWWHDPDLREEWLEKVKDSLDYAVIRLKGAPGLQRGWYRLDKVPSGVPAGLHVLHHPGQAEHTITSGGVALPRQGSHRIFHLASTTGGSSGGLALDQMGRPVGLHYLGLATEGAQHPAKFYPVINVAISLRAIADRLKKRGLLDEIAKTTVLAPARGCLDGRRPLFGRTGFLRDLEAMHAGRGQIMLVHVEQHQPMVQHPGKSFTIDIIKAIFHSEEHHHIVFRAGEIAADALQVARDTLDTFAPDLRETLPAEADTTTAAHARRLVTALGRAIRERLGNRTVWIMLDDLDKHALADASGREFLATLYDQIKALPNLRVVLIGLPHDAAIGGLNESDVIRSVISRDDLSDFRRHFRTWLEQRSATLDKPIGEPAATLLAGIAASYAGNTAPLYNMATFVTEHVAASADAAFGSRDDAPGGGG